jgi:hypothetical protein
MYDVSTGKVEFLDGEGFGAKATAPEASSIGA